MPVPLKSRVLFVSVKIMYCCPEGPVKSANDGPRMFVLVQLGGVGVGWDEGNGLVVEWKAQATAVSTLIKPALLMLKTVPPSTVGPFASPTVSALARRAPTVKVQIARQSKR